MPRIFGQFSIPWKKYLLTLIIAIAVLLPWELYVKVRYDRFIPVASNLSFVFNKANRTLTYLQENKIVPEENKSSNLLKAKLKNIYLFWNPGASGYHLDILKKEYPLSSYAVLLYKILFFTVLGLAGIAAILSYKNRIIILSILVISYFWAVHTVLFPFPRYTLPIIPFVIILAGMGINCLSEFLYARK
jgi:hypothetical protein